MKRYASGSPRSGICAGVAFLPGAAGYRNRPGETDSGDVSVRTAGNGTVRGDSFFYFVLFLFVRFFSYAAPFGSA